MVLCLLFLWELIEIKSEMNQMSEFVLLADMQTELGRIGLVLIENTSKPRLHFGGAVHLENAVVQQGCQALWKFLK